MAADQNNVALNTSNQSKPVVDFWDNKNPTGTLVIHSHGMQDPPNGNLAALDLARPILKKNYAFSTPFNTALNNAEFLNKPSLMTEYAAAFNKHAGSFTAMAAPSLKVYPYLFPIDGLAKALDTVASSAICDIISLNDLAPYPKSQFIDLHTLLGSSHPSGGKTLYSSYENFLLFTCRSSTKVHQVGMGGAKPAYPNGLYPQTDRGAVYSYPF